MASSSTASNYNHSSDVELVEEAAIRSELVEVEEEDLLKFPEIPAIRIPERSEDSSNNNNNSGSNQNAWSSAFHARSHSTTPRSRQSSPRSPAGFRDNFGLLASSSSNTSHGSPPLQATRFSNLYNNRSNSSNLNSWNFLKIFGVFLRKNPNQQQRGLVINKSKGKTGAAGRLWYRKKRVRGLVVIIGLIGFFFLMNWWMLSRLPDDSALNSNHGFLNVNSSSGEWSKFGKGKRPHRVLFSRMLALAAHALAEGESKAEPKDLWLEPLLPVSAWKRCAEVRNWEPNEGRNGYIIVSANGGMNQQRVAVCNAVTLARLLNSTLVVPKFLFSSVWRDVSQFSDIYQEEHFINYSKPDIRVVKELPLELRSLDLEAISSIVTDSDIMKEAKPSFYLKKILPIILKNRVVHLIGFGNRLAFDPIPFELQRLRCRCNFHALRFIPKIQQAGALLLQRMRQYKPHRGPLDQYLVGPFASSMDQNMHPAKKSRYLALHLRFEIDMAAHSMCEFGGGVEEREELEAYRAVHFPALTHLMKTTKLPSAAELRSEGKCPLAPEEAVLMLAALGFKRKTRVYLAGAHIYGGKSRLAALTNLYPNMVTKENLLSSSEIEPFTNYSSQLAALDFIGCAAADAFAMTDSGSQLSSLVTGYRIYYGDGRMPTIRPNKRRLASIFTKNSTIEWREFEERVRKAVKESKQVQERPVARSIYRHPRCPECMCNTTTDLVSRRLLIN